MRGITILYKLKYPSNDKQPERWIEESRGVTDNDLLEAKCVDNRWFLFVSSKFPAGIDKFLLNPKYLQELLFSSYNYFHPTEKVQLSARDSGEVLETLRRERVIPAIFHSRSNTKPPKVSPIKPGGGPEVYTPELDM